MTGASDESRCEHVSFGVHIIIENAQSAPHQRCRDSALGDQELVWAGRGRCISG